MSEPLDDPDSQIGTLEEFERAFNPKEYLDQYFNEIDEEDDFTMRFVVSALSRLPHDLSILEFGAGPVLTTVVALAPYAREIHFSDYVCANLDEVKRWLEKSPDAFDWYRQINRTLEIEGQAPTNRATEVRERLMRDKVTKLLYCDSRAKAPLGEDAQAYDLVTAMYCTDVAVETVPEWFDEIRNITTLVKSGGWLLIGIITGTSAYTMAAKKFPHVELTPDDVRRAYTDAGYDAESLVMGTTALSGKHRDYSGLLMAMARKS